MKTFTVAEREIPLYFSTAAWIEIDKTFGSLQKLSSMTEKGEQTAAIAVELLFVLGNQGIEHENRQASTVKQALLTRDWLIEYLRPSQVVDAVAACMDEIGDAMSMETEAEAKKKADDEPVDVVLQELQAKKQTES